MDRYARLRHILVLEAYGSVQGKNGVAIAAYYLSEE